MGIEGYWQERGIRKFSAVIDTLFWVIVKWVYKTVKTHQTQHLRTLHFTLCKLYLNKKMSIFTSSMRAILNFGYYWRSFLDLMLKIKMWPQTEFLSISFSLTPRIYWQEWGSSIYTVTAWGESDSLHLKQRVL